MSGMPLERHKYFLKDNVVNQTNVLEEAMILENEEISINYECNNKLWDQNEIFSFAVANEII